MKKLTQKFWLWVAGLITLGMVALAGFSQGVFFQGNLQLPGLRPAAESTSLQIVPTSNQLRSGANSLFKIVLRHPKDYSLKRIKLNLAMYDFGIDNVKLILNGGRDVTDQLTPETQTMLNTALRAPNKGLDKTFALVFKDNFRLPAGESTFEIVFNANFFSKESTLIGSLLDAVLNVQGVESVVEGPEEKVELKATYSTL